MARPPARAKSRRPAPTRRAATDERPLVVALTGAGGGFGRLLLPALAGHPRVARVVCLDVADPRASVANAVYHTIDLTDPAADRRVADVLHQEGVTALAHAAFPSRPPRDPSFGHELTVIGTIAVLNACAEVGVRRIAALSTTMVYGARPDNPNYLAEDAPLRGGDGFPWVRDRAEADRLLLAHPGRHAGARVAVLRPCTVMGGNSRDLVARYLKFPIVPTLLGYDPLFQFVHETDVVAAFLHALTTGASGAYNVVGSGVMLLSSAIKLLGNVNWPVLSAAAAGVGGMLSRAGAWSYEAAFFDHLRYLWVADGSKLKRELGVSPRLNSREALSGVPGY